MLLPSPRAAPAEVGAGAPPLARQSGGWRSRSLKCCVPLPALGRTLAGKNVLLFCVPSYISGFGLLICVENVSIHIHKEYSSVDLFAGNVFL